MTWCLPEFGVSSMAWNSAFWETMAAACIRSDWLAHRRQFDTARNILATAAIRLHTTVRRAAAKDSRFCALSNSFVTRADRHAHARCRQLHALSVSGLSSHAGHFQEKFGASLNSLLHVLWIPQRLPKINYAMRSGIGMNPQMVPQNCLVGKQWFKKQLREHVASRLSVRT